MKIETKRKIKKYYQKQKIVDNYIEKRFKEPLYNFEHISQVKILNKMIKKHNCKNILEIAPGPARVTTEVDVKKGVAIDSSEAMIQIAKKRMKKSGKNWVFEKGDAFNLKFKKKFELIFAFRFIFHFKCKERIKLYKQINNSLKDGGLLIFEALNKQKVSKIRKFIGNKKYKLYDKLYKKKELITELENNNFKVVMLYPIISHFWIQIIISKLFYKLKLNNFAKKLICLLEKIKSKQPYEWVVICQKRG